MRRRSNPVAKIILAMIFLILALLCLIWTAPKQRELVKVCTEKTVGWVDYVYRSGHSGLQSSYRVRVIYFADEKEYKGTLYTTTKVSQDQQLPVSYDPKDPYTFYIKNVSPSPDMYEAEGAFSLLVAVILLGSNVVSAIKKRR